MRGLIHSKNYTTESSALYLQFGVTVFILIILWYIIIENSSFEIKRMMKSISYEEIIRINEIRGFEAYYTLDGTRLNIAHLKLYVS